MCQPNTVGAEEAGIYQSFSGLTNYSKKLLFNLKLLKFLTNFQRKSNLFPASFKIISNKITSPLLKNFNPSYVKFLEGQRQKVGSKGQYSCTNVKVKVFSFCFGFAPYFSFLFFSKSFQCRSEKFEGFFLISNFHSLTQTHFVFCVCG